MTGLVGGAPTNGRYLIYLIPQTFLHFTTHKHALIEAYLGLTLPA